MNEAGVRFNVGVDTSWVEEFEVAFESVARRIRKGLVGVALGRGVTCFLLSVGADFFAYWVHIFPRGIIVRGREVDVESCSKFGFVLGI